MNHQQLIEVLAQAWTRLDASELLKYIHPEFQYDSQWVFASMYAEEYPNYITGKFNAVKESGSTVDVSVVNDNHFGEGNMVKLVQDGDKVAYLRIKAKDGKICKMDMCMF